LILRKDFLSAHRFCEANLPGVCRHYSCDVHHKAGRGPNLCRTETWLGLCRPCHQWIHSHPKEAETLGLIERR